MRRRALLTLAASALTLAAPAAAQASQTLTVEKEGTGAGTLTSSPAGIECGATCQASFADATVVTLTATPGPNSQAATWSGCDSVNGEGKCVVTMSSARKVTASFALLQRQLKVKREGSAIGTVTSSPSGINCGGVCTASYEHGTAVTLTGSPGANARAAKWTGCGTVDAEDRCVVTMNAAREVTATFNLVQHPLALTIDGSGTGTVTSSPAGISCSASCTAGFDHGATVVLTGAPGLHTHEAKWSGCDKVSAEDKCIVAMSAARGVTATFDLIQFPLTVTKAGSGGPYSTVSAAVTGIACGEACQANLTQGTVVTLKAVPGPNILKASWTGCDSVSKANECIVTMNAAKEVTATFNLAPGVSIYTLTVEAAGTGKGTITGNPGKISCPSVCSAEVVQETKVFLVATPAEGSVFDHWSGGGCANGGPCETTVKASKTVKAIFTAVGYRTLSIAMPGAGQGAVKSKAAGIDCSSSCATELAASTKLTLTPTAAQGSSFAGWSGACIGAGVCKVTMNEAREVTATFTRNPAPPPPTVQCLVPRLAGRTLAGARQALAAAHCSLGAVRRPKGAGPARLLRVRSSTPPAGTALAAGAKVSVRLGRARRP